MQKIHLIVSSSSYTSSIYIVWNEIPNAIKYEVYKDGELFYDYDDLTNIERPTIFDHDKHTNLFFKDSNHQIYIEDKPQKYTTHEYYVKGYSVSGEMYESSKIIASVS